MADLLFNPYEAVDWDGGERHVAQLHAHTVHPPEANHSGTDPPAVVVDDYHGAGYSVLALSDHEYNVSEPTWPWSDFDRDPHELGMIAVQAVELSVDLDDESGTAHDLLSLFCDLADTDGMSFDEALSAIGDRGGLAVVPHPSRYNDDGEWYEPYFRAHPHLLGVEVVNAADRYPTDRDVWDDLQERLGNERTVWGFSNDDYHGRGLEYAFDRSRNVLLLDDLTEVAVREALIDGRFLYEHVVEDEAGEVIDEPPTVDAIRHDPDRGTLVVDAQGAEVCQWASAGEVVERRPQLSYRDVDGLGSYVRARLVSEGGSETGTQPFLFG